MKDFDKDDDETKKEKQQKKVKAIKKVQQQGFSFNALFTFGLLAEKLI